MNSDLDWSLYRTFLAVVQEGSLSAAARRLGLTQPTVGRHIDALEAATGADLFFRTQRGLLPTELANDLLPYAKTLAATAAAMMRTATGGVGEVRGTVRISASEIVGVHRLPSILAGIRRTYPHVAVELVLSNAVHDLLMREADIALRMTEPQQGTLIARRLPSIELGLHARNDYLERKGAPGSLAELAEHDLIGFDRDTPAIRAIVERFPTFDRALFALRTDSDLAQLAAIEAGLGIGMCQIAVARRNPALTRVLPSEVAVELGLWAVMHEDLKTSARCQAVFGALVDALSEG